MGNQSSVHWAGIIVAIITAIGVIVTAILSRESGERAAVEVAIAATMTAEAKQITPIFILTGTIEPDKINIAETLTVTIPLESPTNTFVSPTETPVSVINTSIPPTATNTALPMGTPVPPTNTSVPPTPIQTLTLTPRLTNTPTQESEARGLQNCGEFKHGEIRSVSGKAFVIGDIIINGVTQFDVGGTSEGTVAFFETEGMVEAPWGAGCYQGNRIMLDEVIQGLFQSGCESTCSIVRVVTVQSNGEQRVEYR